MKFLLVLPLFLALAGFAQTPLSQSARHSHWKWIYKLTKEEADLLYKGRFVKGKAPAAGTLIDSFPYNDPVPALAPGNYLLRFAIGNKMVMQVHTEGELKMKVLNNRRDLVLLLHLENGKIIDDATVMMANTRIAYDPVTKTYRRNNNRKHQQLKITWQNTVYYFDPGPKERLGRPFFTKILNGFPLKYAYRPLSKLFNPPNRYYHFFDQATPYENRYRGYMSFSKPVYKPGDTVRLKAYISRPGGRPVNRELLLRLTDSRLNKDTIIAALKNYRAGGYTWEFVLDDSLDLDLDRRYLLTLEERRSRKYDLSRYDGDDEQAFARKRKVLVRGKFEYEEYELGILKFSLSTNGTTHHRSEVFPAILSATDENNLPVMDGRIIITIKPAYNADPEFHQPAVFLPDTLWHHQQPLEAVGETRIDIPDSVFPAVSFYYQLEAVLLNSNNERKQETNRIYFRHPDSRIKFAQEKDSVRITYLEKGKEKSMDAKLLVYGNAVVAVDSMHIQLPATYKANAFVNRLEVICGSEKGKYILKEEMSGVKAVAHRTKDSVFAKLVNPKGIPVWYTLFEGNKPILRGQSENFDIAIKAASLNNYFLSLQYIYGGEEAKEEIVIAHFDKLLDVSFNAPPVIHPGQRTEIEITVRDAAGRPVEDADVTAYAFTSKFRNAYMPHVPYMGRIRRYQRRGKGYHFNEIRNSKWSIPVNWQQMAVQLGLDSIAYYNFLYTKNIYTNSEATRDSSTEVAPFLVHEGEVLPVVMFFIDEKPVYFSHSQHVARYSLPIRPGWRHFRIRTVNKEVSFHTTIAPGVKNIMGIYADTSNPYVRIEKRPVVLTEHEKALIAKYSIVFDQDYGENYTYLEQDGQVFLLPPKSYPRQPSLNLVGPLMPRKTDLVVVDSMRRFFDAEGGYLFQVKPGLVKQKEVNIKQRLWLSLQQQVPATRFSEPAMSGREADSLWRNYLDLRSSSQDLFLNQYSYAGGGGKLEISIGSETGNEQVFARNIFLFKYDEPDFIRVFKGRSRQLGLLQPGKYRLFVLLKEDKYLLLDSMNIRSGGINFYNVPLIIKEKDSTSMVLSQLLSGRSLFDLTDNRVLQKMSEEFNSFNLHPSVFSHEVTGRVVDKKNDPIPGVVITIKGTKTGTVTNSSGLFRIRTPAQATLVFSAIGYTSVPMNAASFPGEIELQEQDHKLEEVVITGYGQQRRASFTGSVSTVLAGNVHGLQIRGNSSLSASMAPLIVVDGVPYEGDLSAIQAVSVSVLKDESAQKLFGARGANGVILISTKPVLLPDGMPMEQGFGIRRNFRDNAYWQPVLRTDRNGKARFTTVFPDDITSWKAFTIAVSGKSTGKKESFIRSFRPLSATLALPQFLVEGDSINVIGKIMNYGADSVMVSRKIFMEDQLLKAAAFEIRHSHLDTIAVRASGDSLRLRMEISTEGYLDGEERSLAIFPKGISETKGLFHLLPNDSTLTFYFDSSMGPVKIYAESAVLPVLLDEAERLVQYAYMCNEQMASKLKALIVKKKIYRHMNREFKDEKLVKELVSRLNNCWKNQLWGWWQGNEFLPWISLHVAEAMIAAEKEGYKTNLPRQQLINVLLFHLQTFRSSNQLMLLKLLHQLNAEVDYKQYLDSFQLTTLQLNEKLRLMEMQQLAGAEIQLDSLLKWKSKTMMGNYYWGEDSYHLFNNSVQNTLIAYRLIRMQGGHDSLLARIRHYFLEKRKSGQWRNTYESSLILETIAEDLFAPLSASPASVSINGDTVSEFPFYANGRMDRITVEKKGGMPVYFTAWQEVWNPLPQKVMSEFIVNSSFRVKGEEVIELKAGIPVTLHVDVEVKADADYVMIEVPVPAGCSYQSKSQTERNNEVHREFFKNKVSIFCSSLPKGKYSFEVLLLPRYNGRYHLNPARAELMYFPAFYGREGMKSVAITN